MAPAARGGVIFHSFLQMSYVEPQLIATHSSFVLSSFRLVQFKDSGLIFIW